MHNGGYGPQYGQQQPQQPYGQQPQQYGQQPQQPQQPAQQQMVPSPAGNPRVQEALGQVDLLSASRSSTPCRRTASSSAPTRC